MQLCKTKSVAKKNYIWNAMAGILNAAEAVILSVIISRTTGLEDAGILSIAFATANLYVTVGKYGVRNYQVTDGNRFSFEAYYMARFATIVVMILFCIVQCISGILFKGYSMYKAGVIFLICMIFVVEAIEDVYSGEFQKQGELYVGARNFIFRWIGILFSYFCGMLLIGDLLLTTIMAFFVSVVIFFVCKKHTCARIKIEKSKDAFVVLKHCLPLCLMSFLNFYICNAPKYAIDKYLGDEKQACFSFVAMPVFVVGLVSGFLYQPVLVDMATYWNEKRYGELKKEIKKQQVYIGGIFVLCFVGAYVLGIPVLSWLYHTDLQEYKIELMLTILASVCLALANLYNVVITIMRKQKYVIVCYLGCALFAFVLFPFAVAKFETLGAGIVYLIVLALLAILQKIIALLIMNNNVH